MRLVSVVSESSGESFDLMPSQLTPYNLSTLFALSKIRVLAQPGVTALSLADNVFQVPDDCKVCRVTGEPVPLPEDKAQAKQKQQLMAGAKVRLLKSINDAQQAAKEAEHQALHAVGKPPQRVSPAPPPTREPGATSPPPPPQTTTTTPNVVPQQHPAGQPPVGNTPNNTSPVQLPDRPTEVQQPQPTEKVRCQFCGNDIPVQNKLLHEANCKRHKTQCQHCGLYFAESALAAHIEENHTMNECTFCGRSFKPSLLAEHSARCEERLVPCKYCNENVPLSMMKFHEDQCPSRTEKCPYCGMVIGMNLQASHRQECQGQKSATGRGQGGLDTSKPIDVTSRVQRYTTPTPPPPVEDVDELDEDELLARALYQSQLESEGRRAPPVTEPERPISLDSSPPEGVTEEDLSMELIRKLQREQQEADAEYARRLAMGGSEGSFTLPQEEDYRPPVTGTQQPLRMAGGYSDEDTELLNQRLIRQMMAEQEAQNQRLTEVLVRGLSRAGGPSRGGAGSSSRSPSYPVSGSSDSDVFEHAGYLGTVPVSSTGRGRPTPTTGRGGSGTNSRSVPTASPLTRGGTGATRVPPATGRGRKTPPPRPSSALARPGETDEELARRLAAEEYGN